MKMLVCCLILLSPIAQSEVSYEESFQGLYDVLEQHYCAFELKGIDWEAVGTELLPRAKKVTTDEEFGIVCLELVARLEDSHAQLRSEKAPLPNLNLPSYDPGFACLLDDRGKPVVYYVDRGSPAEQSGLRPGMSVVRINGIPAEEAMKQCMNSLSKYYGYSSKRYLRYHAARFFIRQTNRGDEVRLEIEKVDGSTSTMTMKALLSSRYLPRLPVPLEGIRDSADVSWTMLEDNIGYIYVRRLKGNLVPQLDNAVKQLEVASGLIIDVRGNSGGGIDANRAFTNFALIGNEEPERPRFSGPMAVLIDSRCISAGEGWSSWFMAKRRARFFGETTAGASARKSTYMLKNGLYSVIYPIRSYTGSLGRPIERRGLEPDVEVKMTASDVGEGRDTVREAAKEYLLSRMATPIPLNSLE